MTAHAVQSAWEKIQAQALKEHEAHWGTFFAHRSEMERVISFFGARRAMEFAWWEHEVPSLAFLMEFGLMEQGEEFGVFAL